MRDFWVKIILAAVISISCAFLTHLWARSHAEKKISMNGQEPIARLVLTSNDVERRPARHLVWQSVYQHQELYAGEAVRTAAKSEAKIVFLTKGESSPESATTVQLDPDSAIEIEDSPSGVDLHFLKGNLMIHAPEGAPAINLRSGDEAVPIANAEIQVTKTKDNEPLDLVVLKGDSKAISQKSGRLFAERKLQILSPDPNATFYVQPNTAQLVAVTWRPLTDTFSVSLLAGPSRTDLQKLPNIPSVPASTGRIEFPAKPGKTYYKLIGENLNSKEAVGGTGTLWSAIRSVNVLVRVAPVLLTPAASTEVHPSHSGEKTTLSWDNPGRLNGFVVELSRSADLTNRISTENAGDTEQIEVDFSKQKAGRIFWRVSGRIPNTNIMVASQIRSFMFRPSDMAELKAPQLIEPADKAEIEISETKTHAIPFKWSEVQGASSYEVTIEPAQNEVGTVKTLIEEVSLTQYLAAKLTPGFYRWKITAKDRILETAASSPYRGFRVFSKTLLPEPTPSPKPAATPATATPKVGVPVWPSALGNPVVATGHGRVELSWLAVGEAAEYIVSLQSDSGEVVSTIKTDQTSAVLEHVKPGDFLASVRVIDVTGREGSSGSSRKVHVPEYSDLQAPKLKTIDVK